MYFGVRIGVVVENKNNKIKKGKKRSVVVDSSLDVLSKMQSLKILCDFIIGLSAQGTDSWTWTSCLPLLWFLMWCVLLAFPFTLNHISHLISPFFFNLSPPPPPTFPSPLLYLPYFLNSSSITFISPSHSYPSLLLCFPAQSKVTPDHRLPLSPMAMLNNAAVPANRSTV